MDMIQPVSVEGSPAEEETERPEAAAYLQGELRRLTVIAAGILNDRRDVDDAIQETLFAAWQSWDAVRDEGRRRAWLTTICVRRCLRVRMFRSRQAVSPLADSVPAVVEAASDTDWDKAFSTLTSRQRAVVVLHYHHGYTLDECADLMGRHPGTVRRHLSSTQRGVGRSLAVHVNWPRPHGVCETCLRQGAAC